MSIHRIKRATTDLRMRLGFVVFVRGPFREHVDGLEDLWSRLQAGLLKRRFTRYRAVGRTSWTTLPEARTPSSFADQFRIGGPLVGRWGLELADPGDDRANQPANIWLELNDLAPVRGMERASHLRVLFPDDASIATVAALGEWAINRLPLWWGSAGFVFHHTTGTMFTAHERMAALAKRYWGVQIQDMTALQWDALRGMPGVNWLTLIGRTFAEAMDVSIDQVAADLSNEGVFHRRGAHGIALAAGVGPVYGDINVGENLGAYEHVARRLQPLLLTEHTSLFGPFAKPEVLGAWLRRLGSPPAWLSCGIATD
jgi:Type VI immunity for VRR-NUC